MNLEQLCRTIRENYHRLKDERKALLFLRYQFELLAWKRQKLKLGAIVFEIKELVIAGITLYQDVDIRYIRQDTSHEDNLKIENRLKALGFKRDFKNIVALLVVILLGVTFLYAQAYVWYCDNLPTLAYRDPACDQLIRYTFSSTFSIKTVEFLKGLYLFNVWLSEILARYCIDYNVLF